MENRTGPPLVTRGSPDRFLEMSTEVDCILTGDYFELNDLVDPGSRSSRSSDSSCLTTTSEEYFDSVALLQELEEDIIHQEMKDTSVKFNIPATSSVCLKTNKERGLSAEETSKVENGIKGTSNGVDNEHASRTKRRKMTKYLCLLMF